jgi:polar amino acid transport system substrate-binding protein
VRDYVNTDAFDARAAAGRLTVDSVGDDLTNIRKVAAGRIPLAVIDRHVLDYLLRTEPGLQPIADRLQFNARLLEDKQLYVAFQRSAAGLQAAEVVDAGLKKIDAAAISARFFR